MLTDTHAHIHSEYYGNIKEIIERSQENGISRIFNCAVDVKTSKEILELSKSMPNLLPIIGIHPENSLKYTEKDIEFIKDNATNAIAIGEIGLDYHYDGYDKQKQIELFKKMLDIASSYDIPVVIHCRDAYEDTISILKEYKVKGVMHSFSGSKEIANILINMGFVLGINGVLTFRNCKLSETLKNIDLINILVETDSPYLTPEPFRGKENYPGNVLIVAKKLCEIYNVDLGTLSDITNVTISRVFDI